MLLDSYEQERRSVAASVLGLSSATYDALGKLDPAALTRGKNEQQLSISYRAGSLAVAGKPGLERLQAGDRAPDARLRNRAGEALWLFDILRGPHFTLLACGPVAAQELDKIAWRGAGAALRRVIVGGVTGGAEDHQFADFEGSFRAVYGHEPDFLLLIWPDGYIAHRVAKIARRRLPKRLHGLCQSRDEGRRSFAGAGPEWGPERSV